MLCYITHFDNFLKSFYSIKLERCSASDSILGKIKMVEIKLTNGRVRELEIQDILSLTKICRDKEIQNLYFIKPIFSMEQYWQRKLEDQIGERRLKGCIREEYQLSIESENLVKGILEISVSPNRYWTPKSHEPTKHAIILSYFVGKEFAGRGLATEVLNLAVPFAFNNLGAGAVSGICLKENTASQNLLRKVGLEKTWEGVAQAGISRGKNVVVYGLTFLEYYTRNDTNIEQ